MDNINRDIEKHWRELFADQLDTLFYTYPLDTTPESRWFDEGMRHAIMMLRHSRSDDFPAPS